MISAIAIILVFGLLIFFHEFGHFSVAKALKIGVRTFSLGFGPKLASFDWHGTNYRLSAVPLGGYVQLVGESPDEELPDDYDPAVSFSHRSPWQRIMVVAAGPVFNFILAWFIYALILFFVGQFALLPVIGKVQPDTPADRAGLKAGDKILAVDGRKIDYFQDLAEIIRQSKGKRLDFVIQRDGQQKKIPIAPALKKSKNLFGEEIKVYNIGIVSADQRVKIEMGPLDAAWGGIKQTWFFLSLTVEGIVKIFQRVVPTKEVGSVIAIGQIISKQAEKGLLDVLMVTAYLSIILGFMNLLPIPILDGGHILFYALEIVLGRPIDLKWRTFAMKIGLVLLIMLMAFAFYNDIYYRLLDLG